MVKLMKCYDSCRLFGAYQAISGIKDNVVLLHSVVGCNFGTMGFHLTRDMSDMRQSCTVVSDKNIIFNGESSLREAIDNAIELYDPKIITIISGCVSSIIGDDIAGVLSGYKHILPIYYIEGAGFKGKLEGGYEDALLELAKNLVFKEDKFNNPCINLLGLNYDDFKLEEDIEEIKRILGNKVEIICVTADCTIEEFSNMGKAHLNIVFKRGRKLAEFLKSNNGIEYLEMDYPYGIKGANDLLDAVGNFFDIDFEAEKNIMMTQTLKRMKKAYGYLQSFYGLPICIFGQEGRAIGLKRFLEEELGMDVVCLGINEEGFVMEDFIEKVYESDAALVFGSSFEGDIADRLEIPLIRYHYPVFDRISISDTPYLGGRGAVNIVEDILHYVVDGRKNKGALYNEEDLCLR